MPSGWPMRRLPPGERRGARGIPGRGIDAPRSAEIERERANGGKRRMQRARERGGSSKRQEGGKEGRRGGRAAEKRREAKRERKRHTRGPARRPVQHGRRFTHTRFLSLADNRAISPHSPPVRAPSLPPSGHCARVRSPLCEFPRRSTLGNLSFSPAAFLSLARRLLRVLLLLLLLGPFPRFHAAHSTVPLPLYFRSRLRVSYDILRAPFLSLSLRPPLVRS